MPRTTLPTPPASPWLGIRSLLVFVVGALLVWQLRGILLLGFTSVLIAVTLRAVSDPLARRTRLPEGVILAAVILLTLAFVAGTLALFGWRIADQYDEILHKARQGLADLSALADSHAFGRWALQRISGARIDGAAAMLTPALSSVLGSVGQGLAYTAIVIASGIFLAIDPQRHLRGVLLVVPPAHKAVAETFLQRAGAILRKWLVSRLIVMVSIGVLSSIGLKLLGIDGAFTLGLTGGLLTFIPLIGALLAAVPAVLVALAQSPLLAIYVGLMYWAVHFIEGTFITPFVQDAEVDLPPVLTMYSAVVFTVLFGASGIFLASPLALMAIVAIQVFYLKTPAAPPHRRRWFVRSPGTEAPP
jgi:predicted PurR-regulated permease PerM